MKALKILSFILFHSIAFHSVSQTVDQNFQLPIPIRAADIGTVKVQDDGKILVGGNIRFFENQQVSNLIRLNEDGTFDKTFAFTPDSLQAIGFIELLSTGEIMVATPSTLMKLSTSGYILHEIDSI